MSFVCKVIIARHFANVTRNFKPFGDDVCLDKINLVSVGGYLYALGNELVLMNKKNDNVHTFPFTCYNIACFY